MKFFICSLWTSLNVTHTLDNAPIHLIGSFNALPTWIAVFESSSELGVSPPFIAVAKSNTACVAGSKAAHLIFVNVSNIFCADATTSLSTPLSLPNSTAIACISFAVNQTAHHVDFITAPNWAVALSAAIASSITHLKNCQTHRAAMAQATFENAPLIPCPS
jgi:hypothetical protein